MDEQCQHHLGIFFKLLLLLFTLQYCIGFAIYQHASATGVHTFPILNPPPTSLPIPSLRVVLVHQPQASCILHRTWAGNSFLIWYYTCFNAILPNHPPPPSPTDPKRLFYTSVSLLLSRIQGCRYHLSKFHIYALVYCIYVFPSGFNGMKERQCTVFLFSFFSKRSVISSLVQDQNSMLPNKECKFRYIVQSLF